MSRVGDLYEQHKALSVLAAEMYDTGIWVWEAERRRLSNRLLREHRVAKQHLVDLVGIKGFTGTPNQLRALIYKSAEKDGIAKFSLPDPYNPKMYTPSGKLKVNEAAMLQLLIHPTTPPELCKIIDAYWACASPRKARSTFVSSDKVMHAIGKDGRLRPGWNSCGTETGRWACSEPNVMNLPQQLRSMYAAPRGRLLVHGDYSQLELRVMEVVSGDVALKQGLATGNLYVFAAKEMFSLPQHLEKCECQGPCTDTTNHLKKDAYKTAKITQLAKQYAALDPTVFTQMLAADRTITFSKVKALSAAWTKLYAGTVDYWAAEMARMSATGYSETRLMRRRHVYPAPPKPNEVVNYPVQGTAADVMNLMILELRARLRAETPTAKIIFQLHDAVDIECDEDDVWLVASILQECMETPRFIEGAWRTFPTEVKVGVSWATV